MRGCPPTFEARDNLVIMGLLAELPSVGEPLTAERRKAFLEALDAALVVLYPLPAEDAG